MAILEINAPSQYFSCKNLDNSLNTFFVADVLP